MILSMHTLTDTTTVSNLKQMTSKINPGFGLCTLALHLQPPLTGKGYSGLLRMTNCQ